MRMATPFLPAARDRVETAFRAHADPGAAPAMAAYMRDGFPFLGIKSPERRRLTSEVLEGLARPSQADLRGLATAMWELPEREFQYFAVDVLARWVRVCRPGFLRTVRRLVTTKPWWDTIDALAANVVGPLVVIHPDLVHELNIWVATHRIWLARTAILHQLRYKEATDAQRLFRYCLSRAGDDEFFIRKAIGWALREYSKTDAAAVRTFVADHADELSALSQREALKWLERQRPGA